MSEIQKKYFTNKEQLFPETRHKNQESLSETGVLDRNLDPKVYAILYDDSGKIIAEAHAYKAGFFRFNWHDSLDITFVMKGSIRLYAQDGIFDMAEDDICVINPQIGHAAMIQEPGTECMVLLISEEYVQQVLGKVPYFTIHTDSHTRHETIYSVIRSLVAVIYDSLLLSAAYKPSRILSRAALDILLAQLLQFSQQANNVLPPLPKTKDSQKVIRYIDRNFREELSLKQTAEEMEMNPSYLSSYFKTNFRIGFHEYLTRKRLEYAIFMLNNTRDPLLDIALDSGFTDLRAFHRAFRKYFQTTPGAYRKDLKNRLYAGGSTVLPYTDPVVQKKLAEYLQTSYSPGDLISAELNTKADFSSGSEQ